MYDSAIRGVDNMASVFLDSHRAYAPGHEEIEQAFMRLYGQTGNSTYLRLGFGTDSCAGFRSPFIRLYPFYEAISCCTMRGGEGHSFAIQSAYHTRPGELAITLYMDSQAELDLGVGRLGLQRASVHALVAK
jgi:DUF1680 family protein